MPQSYIDIFSTKNISYSKLVKIFIFKPFEFNYSVFSLLQALSKLGSHLNMSLVVPLDYRDNFMAADAMFRHQPVFDPKSRKIVPLTPLPSGAPPLQFSEKDILTPKKALQLAYGNLDPFTMEVVDDWDPDKGLIQVSST